METYDSFLKGNKNIASQITSGTRPAPVAPVNVFEEVTSKADIYDNMKHRLQVSHLILDI